jgi:hypothetical protein
VTTFERLTEVFDRGLTCGVDALGQTERELYLIQYFILEYEMGDLSGYFYNRLPNLDDIRATIAAMRRQNLPAVADLLTEAVDLFRGYVDPDLPTTWSEVLHRYDPDDRLSTVSARIRGLDNYGLDQSAIR